jgi:transposase-like protein
MSHKQQQSNKQQQQSTQPNLNGQLKVIVPDPEVVVVAGRRRFSQSYKKRVLAEAEQCQTGSEVGALLRREGLYSSHLSRWRQARERGELADSTQPKRGRKTDPQAAEIVRLSKENERLKQELEQAQLVVDIQKKVSQLLGLKQTMAGGQQ